MFSIRVVVIYEGGKVTGVSLDRADQQGIDLPWIQMRGQKVLHPSGKWQTQSWEVEYTQLVGYKLESHGISIDGYDLFAINTQ